MDGKNDNIKEMSESQNKNSVIVKGDNVNVTNQIVINNYYGVSNSPEGSNGNKPEKQGGAPLPKRQRFSLDSLDSFFDPVTTVVISIVSVIFWALIAESCPIISLFIIPAVQSIAGYFGFRSAEKCIGQRIHSFLCSAIALSVILILVSDCLYNNSVITYEMMYGSLFVLAATNMFSFFFMYFNIALFNGDMRSV